MMHLLQRFPPIVGLPDMMVERLIKTRLLLLLSFEGGSVLIWPKVQYRGGQCPYWLHLLKPLR